MFGFPWVSPRSATDIFLLFYVTGMGFFTTLGYKGAHIYFIFQINTGLSIYMPKVTGKSSALNEVFSSSIKLKTTHNLYGLT